MNYSQMAEEYRLSADKLAERIETLKTLKKSGKSTSISEINRRIKLLEEMYIDCDFTARIMKSRSAKKQGTETEVNAYA